MPGAHISSREWDGDDNSLSLTKLGTHSGGQQLLTPLRGTSSFLATFNVMFKEEFRKNVEFAKARQMVLFPLTTSTSHYGFNNWSAIFGWRFSGTNHRYRSQQLYLARVEIRLTPAVTYV